MQVMRRVHGAPYTLWIPAFLRLLIYGQLLCWPGLQGQDKGAAPTPPRKTLSKELRNGISVGRPKIFDNRSLTLMLESLSEALRTTQVLDQKTLATALGMQQGFQSQDFTSNLSVTTTPTPATSYKNIVTTGNATTTGTSLPDTTQTTNTRDVASVAPKAPGLDDAQTLTGYTPSYGEGASDLLNDQTNLTYQIFNLRMILERSLSDRLLHEKARLQAVLGFNVTLDPPRTANDAVAVVEVTLDATGPVACDDLSLVSLMPQEKTYNSAALSTKSNAFGGSAVVKMIQVGYSQRRTGKVFYLYRDTDTVAYERMVSGDGHKIVFGWMFRPVLGRRSVSPGLRQLFAVLALPAKDGDAVQFLNAHVATFWKKYDARTMTSFEPNDANRARRADYALSLGLTKPEIFDPRRYRNEVDYARIRVESTSDYESALRPTITKVSWRATGPKSALISAKGTNLFSGTQVSLGDKVYATQADGLTLKSNETFDLATTLDALATGPGAVLGRYGAAVPLTGAVPEGLPPNGIEVGDATLRPALGGYRSLEIHLNARSYASTDGKLTKQLTLAQIPRDPLSTSTDIGPMSPIISVNGHTVDLPYTLVDAEGPGSRPYVFLQANVPTSLVAGGGGIVQVSWPFLPRNKFTAAYRFYDPASVFTVSRFSDKTIFITSSDATGFVRDPEKNGLATPPYCWQLLAGDTAVKIKTEVCNDGQGGPLAASSNGASVTLTAGIPDKVVLVAPNLATFPLDVPKLAPSAPAGGEPAAIQVKQFDSQWVDVTGKDFTGTAAVEANQTQLKFRFPDPPKDAKAGDPLKTLQIEVTRDLTAKPGTIDVTISDTNNRKLGTARLQIACVSSCETGGK